MVTLSGSTPAALILTGSMQLFPNPDDNFSRRLLLKGSSNISSDPPIIPVLFFFFFFSPLPMQRLLPFTSHGVLRDNNISLPGVTQLLRGWDFGQILMSSSWARPKKLDAPMTAAPQGVHSSLLPLETGVLTHTQVYSNVPGCPSAPLPAAEFGTVGGGRGILHYIYPVRANVCESKWGRQTERWGLLCKKWKFLP